MASNHKLTDVIKGRTISGTSDSGGEKTISFSDGSQMTVKMKDSGANSASTGGTVEKVRQDASADAPQLHLDLSGGGTMTLDLAEATGSVTARSKDGAMEYAD